MKKLALVLALLASGSLGSCIIVARGNCDGDCASTCSDCEAMQCDDANCTMQNPCADCREKMAAK